MKTIFCFLISAFCFSARAQMDFSDIPYLAIGNTPSSGATMPPGIVSSNGLFFASPSQAVFTNSITVSGANTMVLACEGGYYSSGSIVISSVTYGGTALTELTSARCPFSDNMTNKWFYLLNAGAGTSNVVTTITGGNPNTFSCCVIALTNVHQTTPFGTPSTNYVMSTSLPGFTNTANGSTTSLIIDQLNHFNSQGTWTAGGDAGHVLVIVDGAVGGNSSHSRLGKTPGASPATMIWTVNVNNTFFSSTACAINGAQ